MTASGMVVQSSSSDQVRKTLLHHSKSTDAEPQKKGRHADTHSHAWRIKFVLSTQDAPAKPINDPHHRIEGIQQTPLLWHHTRTEADRRHVQPKLHDERDDVAEIPILDIETSDPQRRTDGCKECQQDKNRQNQDLPAREELIPCHHQNQDGKADEEVNERYHHRRRWYDQSREVDLADQVGIIDQAVGSLAQSSRKEGPRQNTG